MMSSRRVNAVFSEVTPAPEGCAVSLAFLLRIRWPAPAVPGVQALPDRIDDRICLGPELTLESVRGIGKVLRLLRAARLARPSDPRRLLGRAEEVGQLLERALGTPVVLKVRPQRRIRFQAWTEGGVEAVDDVREILEGVDSYWVLPRNGWTALRLPRETVVRTHTQSTTRFQVLTIDRA